MRQMYRLSRAFKLENGMRSNQLFRNSPLLGYQIYGLARGGRVFSTIPAEANTNSSNSSQDSNQKKKAADDDDFLSRHGGKVALVAFSIAAGLVYTYYLSIQDRNSIEKAVDSYEMPIDPYELLDLRNANQIKGEQFSSLLQKFLEAEQLSKYSDSKINGSTTPNEQDHSEINVNEKSKSSRKVVNIPCLTYEKFIEFIKTNQTTFHQNVSPYYPRLANVILLPYLLERIIQTQVTKDFVPLEKLPTKFPFMMYDILTPEEQEEIDEERENRKKGKIPILAKNKDLFRLYPDGFLSEGNDDLSRPPQGAISSHFVDIPVAYDYLFLLLTMLMQDQNFPINIQQRLSSLYELALSIQVLQSQETSFIPDSSSIISSDAKSDGIISRDVMLRLIYMLQLTGQFPAEKQVIETGVKWPVRLHKRKSPFDMVKVYEEQQKKGEIQEWSYRDFEKFLISNHNCLWGICYHERKHLIPKNEEGAADQNN